MALTEKEIVQAAYAEKVRITEARRICLNKRKYATYLDPAERERLVEDAVGQLEAAERAEYTAWLQVEHCLQMAIKKPWAAV